MSDQTNASQPAVESIAPELADLVADSQTTPQAQAKEVNSPANEDKKSGEEKTKENASEVNDDKKTAENKKDEKVGDNDKSKEKSKDKPKDNPDDQIKKADGEFEVAGVKYDSFDKAVEAVNRINGHNTRLSGENKKINSSLVELESKQSELKDLLVSYQKANQAWKEYFDGNGEVPDESQIDLEQKIADVVEKREKTRSETQLKTQYLAELDDIFAEKDTEQVLPFFKDLIDEYGDSVKVSPKKIYERARREYKASLGDKELKDIEAIDKQVEERVKKELAKLEASKGNGASGGSNAKAKTIDLPPELAGLF